MDSIYSILPRPPEVVGSGLKREGVNKVARQKKTRRTADGKDEYEDLWEEQGERKEEEEMVVYERGGRQRNSNDSYAKESESESHRDPRAESRFKETADVTHQGAEDSVAGEGTGEDSRTPNTKRGSHDVAPKTDNDEKGSMVKRNLATARLATEYGPGIKSCATGLEPEIKHLDEEA